MPGPSFVLVHEGGAEYTPYNQRQRVHIVSHPQENAVFMSGGSKPTQPRENPQQAVAADLSSYTRPHKKSVPPLFTIRKSGIGASEVGSSCRCTCLYTNESTCNSNGVLQAIQDVLAY